MKLKTCFFYIFISLLVLSCGNDSDKTNKKNAQSKSPNFIFILADDQGWNGTSVQMMNSEPLSKSDYYETPNLEKLASQGIKFSNAYASAPVCAPSRYSLQFGMTPARLGLIRVGMNTNHINHDTLLSIPKALKKVNENYVAAHFGKWGMGSNPKALGYAFSDGATKNKDGGFVNNKKQWKHTVQKDPKKIFSITQRATNFMEENAKSNTPFYLQISHYAVHSSIQSREKSYLKNQQKPKGKRHDNTGFSAMTEDLDEGLGQIMKKLKELGIEHNTYIIYMSDNGAVPVIPAAKKYTKSYNFPLSRGKWDAMEGGIRVPLIITGPGIVGNTESAVPVSGSDMLPTIIDLASEKKIVVNNKTDGGSLKNILLNDTFKEVKRTVEGLFFHVPYKNGIALKRPHSAIRKGDYKLLKFQDNGELFLFNLANNKTEQKNLIEENPQKAKELERYLMDYLQEVHAPKWKKGINWKGTPFKTINSTY